MSDYKLITVTTQDVCFRGPPDKNLTDLGLVINVLNYNSESEKDILDDGDTPHKYEIRLIVEARRIV